MRSIKEFKNPRFGYLEDDGSVSSLTYGDESKVITDSDNNPLYSIARLDGLRGRGTVIAFPLTADKNIILDKSIVTMAKSGVSITAGGMKDSLFTNGLYKRIELGRYETPEALEAKNKERGYC